MTKLAVALGFLALNFYTYHFLATQAVEPERHSFYEFPNQLGGGWSCPKREGMDERVRENLGVTDFMLCDVVNREEQRFANVYVGYHATQIREEGGGSAENSIHPPAHCLPGSGWDIVKNQTVPLDLPGLPQENATAKRMIIAKGRARQLVYYWYQSRGRVISQDWEKIVFMGLDRAMRGRTDGSLVRFTVPLRRAGDASEAEAEATFQELAPLVVGRLPDYVPE